MKILKPPSEVARLERDVIVGSTAPQKIPPGGALATCRDCEAKCLLDSDAIRQVGRPAAVVLCDICASKSATAERMREIAGKVGEVPPEGSALRDAIEGMAAIIDSDPRQVTTHFTFDPPSAAAEVQKTMKVQEGGLHATWEWTNDMGMPVLVSRRIKGGQGPDDVMLMPNDKVQFSGMIGKLQHVGAETPKRKKKS